ncbi:MAG: hypothetical protein KBC91_07805, partial [Candidatus Omnitrophica bacterium]|nr:hypothetical protein [Candidatus Omnitrophota bacterium]
MNKINIAFMIALLGLAGCGGSKEEPAVQNAAPSVAETVSAQAAVSNTPVALQGSGSLRGAVKFLEQAPVTEPLQMSADPYCAANAGANAINESLVVNSNGTLRNAFVYIKTGLEGRTYAAPTVPAVLDQQGCRYHP